jgi:hypothetical protein
MSDYCTEDFETYSRLFELKAEKTVELMRILDEKICNELQMPTMRPKDLFRMVMDMGYEVDRMYKKEKNIEEQSTFLDTFVTKDETISKMRTMLQDEFKRYLGQGDE